MTTQRYEEMHDLWHRKLDEAVGHIQKAKELIVEIPPSVLKAISVWGEKGVQTKEGEIVKIDIGIHAGFRERCLVLHRFLEAILKELSEDLSI